MRKVTRRIIHIVTACTMTLLIILLLFMSLKTANTTQGVTDKAINTLSEFYIQEIAKNRASIISDELDKYYTYVTNALSVITEEDLQSPETLRSYLGNMRKLYNIDTFALFDENGLVYTSYATFSGKTRFPFLAEKITNRELILIIQKLQPVS